MTPWPSCCHSAETTPRTGTLLLIDASSSSLKAEVADHKNRIISRYGVSAVAALENVESLDAPFVAEGYFAEKARELEKAVAVEKKRRELAEKGLSATDREELARLRGLRETRRLENRRKRRKRLGKAQRKPKRRR